MLRWVTEFIHENQEEWDTRRKDEEDRIKEELEDWNISKRLEKNGKEQNFIPTKKLKKQYQQQQ